MCQFLLKWIRYFAVYCWLHFFCHDCRVCAVLTMTEHERSLPTPGYVHCFLQWPAASSACFLSFSPTTRCVVGLLNLLTMEKYVQSYYNTLKSFSHLFESDFSEIKSMCFYIWAYFKAKYLFLSTHWLWDVDGLLHLSSLHDLKSARLLY